MPTRQPHLPRLHVPLLRPEDVIPHLGKPTHWKQGRSAKSLADRWFESNDLPPTVRHVLDQDQLFAGAELVDACLERCTDLGDARRSPTQTDLLAILGIERELAIMAVEAKVTESFGDPVAQWFGNGSAGRRARIEALCDLLGVALGDIGPLRYQLFHRTAAAIIEARRYRAGRAIMMVHSFCDQATGLADFVAFAHALGFARVGLGLISESRPVGGIALQLGWASDVPLPEEVPIQS